MSNQNNKFNVVGKVEVAQTKFTWVINDFPDSKDGTKFPLVSPFFKSETFGTKLQWFVSLSSSKVRDKVGIFIHCVNGIKVNGNINVTILNASNDVIFAKTNSNMDFTLKMSQYFGGLVMDESVNKKIKTNNSNKLTLILTFEANKYFGIFSEIEKYKSRHSSSNPSTKLINNKQFSDVILYVEEKELYAYKGILASKSPVFMAMFTYNMTELNCNRVEINDISYDTVLNLLQYIYTDVEPQLEDDETQEKCKSLLIAADKYGLEKLKNHLEKKLVSDIQVDNVFEYLNFADLYNAVQLKEAAIEFIMTHKDEIAESEIYKKFNDLQPNVSCEIFHSLLTNKRRKVE